MGELPQEQIGYNDTQQTPVVSSDPSELATIYSHDGLVDADKAWDMAHSAQDVRDGSVEAANEAQVRRDLLGRIEDHLGKTATTPEEEQGLIDERNRLTLETREISEGRAMNMVLDRDDRTSNNSDQRTPRQQVEVQIRKYETESQKLRRSAEKIEEWAGILHDHPVSDSFLERHDLDSYDVTPGMLVEMERDAIKSQDEAEVWKTKLAELEQFVAKSTDRNMVWLLCARMSDLFADTAADERFRELALNDATTIGDLKQCFQRACDEKAVAVKAGAGVVLKMLDDIRQGRASE